MKYLSYILAVVSFVLGHMVLWLPWTTGIAHKTPNPDAELNAVWGIVNQPPLGPEATAEACFWEPALSIAPCKVHSRTEWVSDDVQQTFRLLSGIGIGLFALQAASWCLFVGRLVWVKRRAIHISLFGLIVFCLVCGVAGVVEAALLNPIASCDPPPGIFIKSLQLVQPTLIQSLSGLVTGLVVNVMAFWRYRHVAT